MNMTDWPFTEGFFKHLFCRQPHLNGWYFISDDDGPIFLTNEVDAHIEALILELSLRKDEK